MSEWRVTAAVTTYRREWATVRRALDSVLGQTYSIAEVLLIDDNGADSSWALENRRGAAGMPGVRYVAMEKNGGVAAARNRAIDEARGDLIAFLDDDDEWLPGKIAAQARLFDETPGLGVAFVTGRVRNEDTGKEYVNWQREVFMPCPGFGDMLYTDYVGSASSPLLSLSAVREAGGFLTEGQPAAEDYELWIRLAKRYPVRGVADALFLKHTDNREHVSGNLSRVGRGFKNIYRLNRAEYAIRPRARVAMLWNIARCGVRALDVRAIPDVCRWAFWKTVYAMRGEGDGGHGASAGNK